MDQYTGRELFKHGKNAARTINCKAWNSHVGYPSRKSNHDTEEFEDSMFNQIFKENVQGQKHPGCAYQCYPVLTNLNMQFKMNATIWIYAFFPKWGKYEQAGIIYVVNTLFANYSIFIRSYYKRRHSVALFCLLLFKDNNNEKYEYTWWSNLLHLPSYFHHYNNCFYRQGVTVFQT